MAFGRLDRAPAPQPMSEINVTPLVDVMLVLVVIFIITAPLLAGAVRLELPSAQGAQPGQGGPAIAVVLDGRGQVFLEGRPVTLQELSSQLAAAARRDPATELQLRADQGVPYGQVVEIMGAAHQAGLGRIGFVAQPPAQE